MEITAEVLRFTVDLDDLIGWAGDNEFGDTSDLIDGADWDDAVEDAFVSDDAWEKDMVDYDSHSGTVDVWFNATATVSLRSSISIDLGELFHSYMMNEVGSITGIEAELCTYDRHVWVEPGGVVVAEYRKSGALLAQEAEQADVIERMRRRNEELVDQLRSSQATGEAVQEQAANGLNQRDARIVELENTITNLRTEVAEWKAAYDNAGTSDEEAGRRLRERIESLEGEIAARKEAYDTTMAARDIERAQHADQLISRYKEGWYAAANRAISRAEQRGVSITDTDRAYLLDGDVALRTYRENFIPAAEGPTRRG